jgi:hypothetical protein
MKKHFYLLAVLSVAFAFQTASAQSQAEKEKAAFIANAHVLEKKPFDPNARDVRAWGFKWVADTDQVTVGLCGTIMMLIPEKKNKYKAELLMQQTFGMAAFKLENPDKKNDEKAAQLAGFESMLRTYEVMVAQDEKAKNSDMDALLAKQKSGELKAVLDAAFDAGHCEVKGSN